VTLLVSTSKFGYEIETVVIEAFDLGLIVESIGGERYQLRVPEFTEEYQTLDRESKLHEVIGATISVYEFIQVKGRVSQLSEAELDVRAENHKKRMAKLHKKV
jgi:hypothetical protein